MNIEKNVENFIINAAYGEVLNYKKQGKVPVVEEYEKNQWSYILEVMILTIKSLKPSENMNGNTIDYSRLKSELMLWTQYRHGMNKNLLNAIDDRLSDEYFTDIDETIYARLCVIVAGNQNWDTAKHEVIKTVLYSTASTEMILESIMLARVLYSVLIDAKHEEEALLTELKSEAINLSQTELEDYDQYFKMPKSDYTKDYKIEFERTRINLISLLNGINLKDDFKTLKTVLRLIKDRDEELDECGDNDINNSFFVMGLKGLLKGDIESGEIKDIKFLKSLCSYVVKLRKGRITLESLEIDVASMPDVFEYGEDQSFTHPLLNSCKVIYKGKKGDYNISYIQTRTGIYRFVHK